eukprot:jgi/Orpsp1_1/1187444/evm.model.d7180000057741.1
MCIKSVEEIMHVEIEKFYVEKHFPENVKLEVKDMTENAVSSMINRIQNLEWLDESTREYAIEKVMKLNYIIGYYSHVNTSYIVNAFYNPRENLLKILTGYVQPPNFDVNQPDYINYAITGSTLGHELIHAFDNDGKQFNGVGEFKDWWTENDNKEFDEFSQCFID